MRCKNAFALLFFFASLDSIGQNLPFGFVIETFAEGIEQPTQLDQAPDGRIFVAERTGKIRVIENGVLLDEPFYEVITETPGERGITGLKLHPDFDTNGLVYIYYTIQDSNQNRLVRVQALGNAAIPNSEEELFVPDEMWAAWHNGGGMAFDDENYLFLGVGDGTGWQNGQNYGSTLGKILRLNDDGSIPDDNPFYQSAEGNDRAIWAGGIRNPYTMARQNSTGRIFFNDVGGSEWEEVNEVIEGANYGWGIIEGPIEDGIPPPNDYQDPIYAYSHENGCAIVGADFYEPENLQFPESYEGRFLYMEHCWGIVYSMSPDDPQPVEFISGLQTPNNLLVLNDGSLLITEIYNNRILRVSYQGSGAPFISEQTEEITAVPGEPVGAYVIAAGEEPISYQWYRDGVAMNEETSPILNIAEVTLEDDGTQIICTVSNEHGIVTSEPITINVIDDTRPTIVFETPIPGVLYSSGDTLFFSAAALDNEDGSLTGEAFTWNIDFHHNVHKHPALTNYSGTVSGFYVIPVSGEVSTDVWYRVNLKVEDSAGLVSESYMDVLPKIVSMHVDTEPAGISYRVDGTLSSEESILSVDSMLRTLTSDSYQIVNNGLWKFQNWGSEYEDTELNVNASDTIIELNYNFLHSYLLGSSDENVEAIYYTGIGDNRQVYKTGEVERIDFNWSLLSPFIWEDEYPIDYFSIAYQGSILAPYTGLYNLSLLHDSRVQFFLEDSLLIDETSFANQMESHSISVELNAGQFYNFVIDYHHFTDFAKLRFNWEFSELMEHVIPEEQLFLTRNLSVGTSLPFAFPSPSDGIFSLSAGAIGRTWNQEEGILEIFDNMGRMLFTDEVHLVDQELDYRFLNLSGEYFLRLSNGSFQLVQRISFLN